MAYPQFVMRIALGQLRHQPHLVRGRIARNAAFWLEGNIDDGVAINPVRREIVAGPTGKPGMQELGFLERRGKA